MRRISPENHTFIKRVNEALEISVTYLPVPESPHKFDCVVTLSNVHEPDTPVHSEANGNPQNADDPEGPHSSTNTANGKGWFSSLWASEEAHLVSDPVPEVPLLLGYIQVMGYARLNHQIGAETGSESTQAVYWKNSDYVSSYSSAEADDKVEQILHTPLFKANVADKNDKEHKSTRIGGVPDLHATSFDSTSHYLMHDLVHSFGTMEMPGAGSPGPTPMQDTELSTSISRFIVPFYVTAQHLMFASTTIAPGQNVELKFRIDLPPETLPPSYNTKSTGSVGDAGLASIAYSLIVGVQEEAEGEMKHRAVYFPMEFRPGHYGPGRTWLQHDYLQEPVFDQSWSPERIVGEAGTIVNGLQEAKTVESVPNGGNASCTGSETEVDSVSNKGDENSEDLSDIEASTERLEPFVSGGKTVTDAASVSTVNLDSVQGKFLDELDSLIEGSLETVAAKERRKSSVSYINPADRGMLSQMPEKPRVSYQIRVNNQSLCVLTMSSSTYHVGDDILFHLKLHPDFRMASRVVGFTSHVEAHEIFHVSETRKILNVYKATPTVKANTYADALMFPFTGGAGDTTRANTKTHALVNLPRFLAQQFQASSFMDLRYFMVFRFVLNEFPEMESYKVDEDLKAFTEYVSAYKVENEANEFRFSIPLTVLA